MSKVIEATSTLTTKGQTTVPKVGRQMLGISDGDKLVYRIENGCVTVNNLDSGYRDPALAAYLGLIEADLSAGRNLRDLPAGLASAMQRAKKEVRGDLNETLNGDVAL